MSSLLYIVRDRSIHLRNGLESKKKPNRHLFLFLVNFILRLGGGGMGFCPFLAATLLSLLVHLFHLVVVISIENVNGLVSLSLFSPSWVRHTLHNFNSNFFFLCIYLLVAQKVAFVFPFIFFHLGRKQIDLARVQLERKTHTAVCCHDTFLFLLCSLTL